MDSPTSILSVVAVVSINLVQLIQVLSFIKTAPESGSWDDSAKNLFDFCKALALRFDDNAFKTIYVLSVLLCFISLTIYLIFYRFIHAVNISKLPKAYILYFFEYIIFALGFIPMISRFIEVQFCDDSLDIKNWTDVKCFKGDQLALLLFGFFCIGVALLMNAVVFPVLKCERRGIEKLWRNENYVEAYYYLVMLSTVSLTAYLQLPWEGVIVGCAVFLYMVVFECYEVEVIAASRCGVVAGIVWALGSACVLKHDHSGGNTMLFLTPLGYLGGFAVRIAKKFLFKRVEVVGPGQNLSKRPN